MNIAMEQTEEYVDGQLKSKYGDCFIRGNNGEIDNVVYSPITGDHILIFASPVLYISSQKR
jgi:hypothetical protein